MEAPISYFTRRARQERTSAADATSPEARSAHLELALRLVRIATEPALWSGWSDHTAGARYGAKDDVIDHVGDALGDAFPLLRANAFEQLVEAMDKKRC